MEDSFKGARKNFNIAAVLLIILYYTQVNIEKVSIFGISSAIEDTHKIYIVIWALLAFYLFRYIQMLSFQLNHSVCKDFCELYGKIPIKGKRFDVFKEYMIKEHKCTSVQFRQPSQVGVDPIIHSNWLVNEYYIALLNEEGRSTSTIFAKFPLWRDPSFWKNLLNFGLIKPHFLNYFLPLLLLIFVIIVALDNGWEGSIWSLLYN